MVQLVVRTKLLTAHRKRWLRYTTLAYHAAGDRTPSMQGDDIVGCYVVLPCLGRLPFPSAFLSATGPGSLRNLVAIDCEDPQLHC